jgi:hypothetical protein
MYYAVILLSDITGFGTRAARLGETSVSPESRLVYSDVSTNKLCTKDMSSRTPFVTVMQSIRLRINVVPVLILREGTASVTE